MHETAPAPLRQGRLYDLTPQQKRALLVGTYAQSKKEQAEEQLRELASLCDTYGLKAAIQLSVPLRSIDSSTFIGKGKVEEIAALCEVESIDIVIFDDEISPQQQRNLEKELKKSVIDRTELILGVFAQRAHTREAKIQVEMAELRYQLPRLTRLWTHLSRQRSGGSGKSGGGFVKGEGEKQIELDRRMLKKRVDQLQKELKEVEKHRQVQRNARMRNNIPTFAIIGYTNAGKSTLLRALTAADVLVEDKLFATLDTTTRKFILPNRQEILLIDTVGFIRKLPHLLVAAFKSTLEEAAQADILLHLIDVSSPQAALEAQASFDVLKEMGAEKHPMITLLNKVDRCEGRLMIEKCRVSYPKTVEISALTGLGFEKLFDAMAQEISLLRKRVRLRIPQVHYALVSEVMRVGKVFFRDYEGDDVLLEVEIPRELERKVAPYEVQ